jgi:hypothetical protein
MKKEFENAAVPKEEIDKMEQWLKGQTWLGENETLDKGFIVLLYKLYRLEERLERIEYNQQTHWAN